MDSLVVLPTVVLFAASLLVEQRVQRFRTRESLEHERVARGRLSWYASRYFYSAKDFEEAGRKTFRVGQALRYSAALWALAASIFLSRP